MASADERNFTATADALNFTATADALNFTATAEDAEDAEVRGGITS